MTTDISFCKRGRNSINFIMKNSFCDCTVYSPTYNGNGSFEGFWMQFSIYAERYQWNNDDMVCNLCISLRDKALEYASYLPLDIRSNISTFYSAFKSRFGDNETPEMCRIRLRHVSKLANESIQEYVCRVEIMVRKSFPGITNDLHTKLTTEYSLSGYPDPDITFKVMVKQPLSVSELIREIMWHELCREEFNIKTPEVTSNNDDLCEQSLNDFPNVSRVKAKVNFIHLKNKHARRKCSRCKLMGHIRRVCPKRKSVCAENNSVKNLSFKTPDLNDLWLRLMVNSQPVV